MKWIIKHKVVVTIIVITLIASLFFGISLSRYKSGKEVPVFLNGIFLKVIGPVNKAGNDVRETGVSILNWKSIAKENQKLKKENFELKEELEKNELNQSQLKELRTLSKALNYDFLKEKDPFVTADIILTSGEKSVEILTINKGKSSGIKEGQIVIYGNALVGKVFSVSKDSAKIETIANKMNKVSFTVKDNKDILGIVKGAKSGVISGYMLEGGENISDGDEIETSGMALYPKGISIGKIINVNRDSNKGVVEINVRPKVNFFEISKVSIIK